MKRRSKYLKLVGRPVVVDANVLFDLRELDSLHLLNEIFSEVMIAQDTINKELDAEIIALLKETKYTAGLITTEAGYTAYALSHSRSTLSHYDKMAIALAVENDFILCTNEGPARKQAAALKIDLTGTLGILAAAYQNGSIDVNQVIHHFRYLANEGSCYVSTHLINRVLTDLGLVL